MTGAAAILELVRLPGYGLRQILGVEGHEAQADDDRGRLVLCVGATPEAAARAVLEELARRRKQDAP